MQRLFRYGLCSQVASPDYCFPFGEGRDNDWQQEMQEINEAATLDDYTSDMAAKGADEAGN